MQSSFPVKGGCFFHIMAGSNFIDYVKIYCKSGRGGRGSTHLLRNRMTSKGGPDGGDGGSGIVIIRFLTSGNTYDSDLANIQDSSIFEETDTNKSYVLNSGTWTEL